MNIIDRFCFWLLRFTEVQAVLICVALLTAVIMFYVIVRYFIRNRKAIRALFKENSWESEPYEDWMDKEKWKEGRY